MTSTPLLPQALVAHNLTSILVFHNLSQPEDAPSHPVLRKRETKLATRVVQCPSLVTRFLILMYWVFGLRLI